MLEGAAVGRKMKTEKPGPLNFSPGGKKDLGEEKRMEEPVHDSFTLLNERKCDQGEEGKGP